MISPRAIALQGVGFGPRAVALQGFTSLRRTPPPAAQSGRPNRQRQATLAWPEFPLTVDLGLRHLWLRSPGIVGWLSAVNHRAVGLRFMVTSVVFFLVAGVEALLIRVQLAAPDLQVLDPDTYNQFFTMHGSTMMFLFAVPFLLQGLTGGESGASPTPAPTRRRRVSKAAADRRTPACTPRPSRWTARRSSSARSTSTPVRTR